MARRRPIPKATQAELLTLCARRCCLCFGLKNDFGEKKGQIAHLDDDPSNNDLENLAWLCLDHHDQYDSRTSQSKGLTIGEVKQYREELYQRVAQWRADTSYITEKASSETVDVVHGKVSRPAQVKRVATPREGEPRIFLCHAHDDKESVRELYHQLQTAGYHPWLDEEDLLPGQKWRTEIRKIITAPDNLVLVCLSCNSVTKRGEVQREIKWALDVLEKTPEEAIYLIPARLEPCQVPEPLADLHWVNLFEPHGFEKLKRALDYELGKRQAASPPEPAKPHPAKPKSSDEVKPKRDEVEQAPPVMVRQPFEEPELILIPAGEFLMGSDPEKDKQAGKHEQPQHKLYLPDYYIAKTPVTNAQYLAFVEAMGYRVPKHWKAGKPPAGKEQHPVANVTWHDALAFCKWLSERAGRAYALPSEAEWEKAARGADGRIYPWGMIGTQSGAIAARAAGATRRRSANSRRKGIALTAAWTWPGMCGSGRGVCGGGA